MLWLDPVKPKAVVEREVSRGFPVVLQVPLCVVVNKVHERVLGGLLVRAVNAQNRVGVPETRIQGIIGVVAEVHPRIWISIRRLPLPTVIEVKTQLARVTAYETRDAGDEVVRPIDIGPRVVRAQSALPYVVARRRIRNTGAPIKPRRQLDAAFGVDVAAVERKALSRITVFRNERGVWIQERKIRKPQRCLC